MARMTLADMLDEIRDEIPGKEQAPIVRGLNKVIRRIQTELVEPVRSTFTTRAEVTTGTVDVNQDSVTVTFSSGVLGASDPLAIVQISGNSTWFVVTRNGADTDGILSSTWPEATNATATFTLVYPLVTLDSAVGEITSVKRFGEQALVYKASGGVPYTIGQPLWYSPYSIDTSSAAPDDDRTRIYLGPAPTTREAYTYWYRERTPFLDPAAATTVTIPFTDLWRESVVQGVLYFMWKQEGDMAKAGMAQALYESSVARARGASQPAAVIQPRNVTGGLYAYEDRPISSG